MSASSSFSRGTRVASTSMIPFVSLHRGAGERKTLENVARYMLRSPVSLSRMQWSLGSPHVLYAPKSSHHDQIELLPPLQKIDALEFLARVITQIPEPRRHLLFYYGHYSDVLRGRRQSSQTSEKQDTSRTEAQEDEPTLSPARKQALRRRWADLIQRVFEVDPLVCPCGGKLRVVAFIKPASWHPSNSRPSKKVRPARPSPSEN